MKFRNLMAAVRKGSSGAVERITSAGSAGRSKPKGTPLKAYHPNSSPVYKTQSESSLTAGVRNLTIKDKKDKNITKRTFSSRSSGNTSVKSLTDASSLLKTSAVQNVVIVAGAGISTPSGIPDFRSPGTGLYDNLQQYQIPYPEAIFDIDYFHTNPRPFYTLAKELYPSGKYRPNYIHYFARLLHDKGMLLRMYTQNIDGLERLAGVPADKLVEAHGTFATATCTICRLKLEGEDIKEKIFADKLPRCPSRGCIGIVKPDIVFFGEDLPRKFYSYMKDMLQTDMVLVMGTSLEVQPFAGIIDTVRTNVPRILFNREAVGPFRFSRRSQDIVAAGDLIDNMVKFSGMIGWSEDMVQLITKEEGEFKIINKSPPKAPGNQTRNYSSLAYRYRGPVCSDSSTEEEESETETSSDSSEEETKIGQFRGIRRGKVSNGFQRNGAFNKQNAFRSSSAKLDNSNKRRIHTEASERNNGVSNNSYIGNMTGRSVKSESGLNKNLSKRRLENKTNEEKSTGSSNFVKNTEKRESVTKADRERVLRKYGLSPHPKFKSSAVQSKINDATVRNKVAVPETVYMGQRRDNTTSDSKSEQPQTDNKVAVQETEFMEQRQDNTSLDCKSEQPQTDNGLNVIEEAKDNDVHSTNKAVKNSGEGSDKLLQDKHYRETPDFQREKSIVSGYCIDEIKNTIGTESNTEDQLKSVSSRGIKEKENYRDIKTFTPNYISDCDSNLSSESKVLKKLNDKTAQSFAKYASMSMQRRVIEHKAQTKPPLGPRQKKEEKNLGKLNPRPYGFANKFKTAGVIPFRPTQPPPLNRSIHYSEIISIKSPVSTDLPRISYRHKLQETANKYDARIFGPRPGIESSTDDSDDDSR